MSDDLGDAGLRAADDPGPPPRPRVRETPVTIRAGDIAVDPLTARELSQALVRPDLMAAQVLGSIDRLALNLSAGESPGLLTAVLALASVAASVPFGACSPDGTYWKPAALFAGSLAICFPCLHVFLQFLGVKISLVRNLSLLLVITATAGLFTLGFFPIMWFIDATTAAGDGSGVTPADLMRLLLAASLLMGIVQMCRCLTSSRGGARESRGMTAPILCWLPLLLFITWRMATVLGLRG